MLQAPPSLESLAEKAAAGLLENLHAKASITAAAPGRVNLIGEHIDYCDGFVLPFAIDRYIVIAGTPNGSSSARIATSLGGGIASFEVSQAVEEGEPKWTNYLRGVIRGFQNLGHAVPGFDAYILSSVPGGAGLSSSAALECATATFLEGLLGVDIGTREKALLCQKAEHDFAHVPCGIMDQFASAIGAKDHLVLIDCMTAEPQLVPFSHPDLTVLISNTMVHHELSDGGYALRRKLGDPVNRRARHVVGEIARTIEAAAALKADDFEKLGPLMAASHQSLRDDFEVSCKELDVLVDAAANLGRSAGVIGARMTGGGFGVSTVPLCVSAIANDIASKLAAEYHAKTGLTAEIFASRPSAGAHRVL
ncbi:MAG: galactokinase [Verrucomicrobia bacterium]|nr:galactokinase [Verrucomicrobiota bacterium]